jgi:hypothetical protein
MGSFYNAVIGPMQKLVRRKSIPLLYSGPQLYSHPLYQVLLDKDVPIFDFWDAPTKCLKILVEYSEYRRKIQND